MLMLKKINKIIVNNIGLSEENIKFLLTFDKVEIHQSEVNIKSAIVHSEEWLKALTMKTKKLLNIVQKKDNLPVVMIDSDCLVVKDFSHVIDSNYDIQICKREYPSHRPDLNIKMKYIGSFAIINNNRPECIRFLEDWINEIQTMGEKKFKPAYESPSLCYVIENYRKKLKIQELEEAEVSCNNNFIENKTLIIHLKSIDPASDGADFNFRISNVSNFEKFKILKYLK